RVGWDGTWSARDRGAWRAAAHRPLGNAAAPGAASSAHVRRAGAAHAGRGVERRTPAPAGLAAAGPAAALAAHAPAGPGLAAGHTGTAGVAGRRACQPELAADPTAA